MWLKETKLQTFHDLLQHPQHGHILDDNLRDDHITVLIKYIAKLYLQLFLYQFGKFYTEHNSKLSRPKRSNPNKNNTTKINLLEY